MDPRLAPAVVALALSSLVGCGGEPAPADAPSATPDSTADAAPFVAPEPPELEWFDLPTDRRQREAEAASERDAKALAAVRERATGLLAGRAHELADRLTGADGLRWFDALGAALASGEHAELGAHVTRRGVAAGCLLLAIDSGHVPPERRALAWEALDRVAGVSSDWPGRPARPEPRAEPAGRPLGGGALDLVVRVAGASTDPVSARAAPRPSADPVARDVGVTLSILARFGGSDAVVKIPREPPEGWNPASKRLFEEMPTALRARVDTEIVREQVSGHASMRAW